MSRKPDTPTNDKDSTDLVTELNNIPPGRRFSGNEELLRLESDLLESGVALDNRAIPVEYHEMNNDYDAEQVSRLVTEEVSKDVPNKSLIGYLNQLKENL